MVISYRRCGTTYRSRFEGSRIKKRIVHLYGEANLHYVQRYERLQFFFNSWPLKMGPTSCPETSVRNYHCSFRNNPEQYSSHLLRGGSLKSLLLQIKSLGISNIQIEKGFNVKTDGGKTMQEQWYSHLLGCIAPQSRTPKRTFSHV
jgi:hypothetical protein